MTARPFKILKNAQRFLTMYEVVTLRSKSHKKFTRSSIGKKKLYPKTSFRIVQTPTIKVLFEAKLPRYFYVDGPKFAYSETLVRDGLCRKTIKCHATAICM